MSELRRMAYLEALGVDCYLSRAQLPGAAASRPLRITKKLPAAPSNSASSLPSITVSSASAIGAELARGLVAPERKTTEQAEPKPQAASVSAISVPRFSLATIVAGDWLWLEELGDMPLTTEQVQLVQAMAHALQLSRRNTREGASQLARPDILRFDWPMHNNRQLDLSEEAAQAGVIAFMGRRVEQHRCRGVVLLGKPCATRVSPDAMQIPTVFTASTAEMLQTPNLKRQVWQDLQVLLSSA